MKQPIFSLLCWCSVLLIIQSNSVVAQLYSWEEDSTSARHLSLPQTKEHQYLFAYAAPVFIDNTKDYYALFDEKDRERLPAIDFEKYYLHGVYRCIYCRASSIGSRLSIEHDSILGWYEYEPRHRNACSYSINWYLRSREHSSIIPFQHLLVVPGSIPWKTEGLIIESDSAYQKLKAQYPTLPSTVDSIDFSRYVVLANVIWGDCRARYQYEVLRDQRQKKYILQVYNISGGCPSAATREYWIKIPKAPPGYAYGVKVIPVHRR